MVMHDKYHVGDSENIINLRKWENTHCYLRTDYFVTVNQFMIASVYFGVDNFNLGST
jgi:hypothetical protein